MTQIENPETDNNFSGRHSGNKYINPGIFALFNLLIKKWKLFLIAGVLAGIGGFFYAYIQKPQFESRLTFALDAGSSEGGLSGAMNLAAQFGLGLGAGQNMFDGDNILEILKSRRIIENVLLSTDTFNSKPISMMDFYLEISGLRKIYNDKERLKNISFPVGSEKKNLSYVQDSILNNAFLSFSSGFISSGRPDKKLSIYEVKVTSLNEKFTKDFTDRLVEATTQFYTEITSKKDRETLEILEQRVESLKNNVGASINTKASSQDANVNPAFATAQVPAIKQQYNMQAYGEAYKEMFKTLEMARYQYLKKIPLLQIIDHADYPMKMIKTGKIKTGLLFSIIAVFFIAMIIWLSSLLKRDSR